jgi:hypothetical protein
LALSRSSSSAVATSAPVLSIGTPSVTVGKP